MSAAITFLGAAGTVTGSKHGDPVPARALATRIAKELGWAVDVPAYRDRLPIE